MTPEAAAIIVALIAWAEIRLLPVARRIDTTTQATATKVGALPSLLLALALGQLVSVGCVQVAIVTDRSRSAPQRQDVARTTSSTQTAETALDVPVSLIPK